MLNFVRIISMLLSGFILSGCMSHSTSEHAAHQAMLAQPAAYERAVVRYQVPDVILSDQAGRQVRLPQLLESSEPYALNFIFTSCTTICPIMSASFFQLQQELGPGMEGLTLISVSIDPEFDTPATLNKYAQRYKAGSDWQFLTGEVDSINKVQQAFSGFVSDKMNHQPFTLLKLAGEDSWLRIGGLASGADLAVEYRRQVGR